MTTLKSPPTHWRKALLLVLGLCAALTFFIRPPEEEIARNLPEVMGASLILRDSRLYHTDEKKPFAGFMSERYETGQLKSRSAISHGLLNGLSTGWHTNGVRSVKEYFSNGVSNGLREKWHSNGIKLSEVMVVNGKLHGIFRRWYENGQLAEQISMKEGDSDGLACSYYPSGFLKMQATTKSGELLAQRSWKDGETRTALQ